MKVGNGELESIVTVVSDVARSAGNLLRVHFLSNRVNSSVQLKEDSSPVTAADLESQNYIEERLHKSYPSFGIVSEEKAIEENLKEFGELFFVVDPLDSTKNFIKRIPFFDVSIALYSHEKPLIGVVYDPIHDMLYSSVAGKGARCNGRVLHTKDCKTIENADIDINCTKLPKDEFFIIYNVIARKCRKVRYFGNAVLEICWIASGQLDAMINHNLSIWDVGACGLILEEAGGIWSTLEGKKPDISKMSKFPIAASGSKALHSQLISVIQGGLADDKRDPSHSR